MEKSGTDGAFPYPIKLTYDSDYIYLTPLEFRNDRLRHIAYNWDLFLCLEMAVPRKNYLQGRKGGKHPCKGGKFKVPHSNFVGVLGIPDDETHPSKYIYRLTQEGIGQEFAFPIDSSDLASCTYHYFEKLHDESEPVYTIVRGCYRILDTYGNFNRVDFCEAISNQAKIYYNL